MTIIRAATGSMEETFGGRDDQMDSLRNRIRELERRLIADEQLIANGFSGSGKGAAANIFGGDDRDPSQENPALAAKSGRQEAAPQQPDAAASGEGPKKPRYPKAIPEDVKEIVRNWTAYISKLPPGLTRVALMRAGRSIGENGQLVIVFENFVAGEHFKNDERYRNRFRTFLRQCSGKDVEIEYKTLDKGQKFTDNYVDLDDMVKMEIEESEDI